MAVVASSRMNQMVFVKVKPNRNALRGSVHARERGRERGVYVHWKNKNNLQTTHIHDEHAAHAHIRVFERNVFNLKMYFCLNALRHGTNYVFLSLSLLCTFSLYSDRCGYTRACEYMPVQSKWALFICKLSIDHLYDAFPTSWKEMLFV